MSTSTVNILDFYKRDAPRGNPKLIPPVIWNNTAQGTLTVVGIATAPQKVRLLKQLSFYNASISINETVAGDGLFDISYPSEDGESVETYTIDDLKELAMFAKEIRTISSDNVYIIEFKPSILLDGSKTNYTFTIAPNANVSGVASGELKIAATVWELLASDY